MRVPFDRIEHEEYTNARLQGVPFTGTAFDLVEGSLLAECDFVDGKVHGIRREYFASGCIEEEVGYDRGRAHGLAIVFFEDGSVCSKATYEYGELLESQEFAQDGMKVSEYKRESGILREWRGDGSLRKETIFASPTFAHPQQVIEERFYNHEGKPTLVSKQGLWRMADRLQDA